MRPSSDEDPATVERTRTTKSSTCTSDTIVKPKETDATKETAEELEEVILFIDFLE